MYVDNIIAKEVIDPSLLTVTKGKSSPDWKKITLIISRMYNSDYAKRTILGAQLKWYNEKMDWPNIAKYTIRKIDKYGLDTAGVGKYITNNILYEVIFKHSNNRKEITKASRWMGIIVNSMTDESGNFIDTYANLLYKGGETELAIIMEEKAAQLISNDLEIQASLAKMKRGEPTW
jgi:hypothetical protein